MFSARRKLLNRFKSRLLPIKKLDKIPTREPTPEVATKPVKAAKATKRKTKRKISSLKYESKNINEQIFRDCFLYQTPSYLTKVLYDSNEIKNNKIIKHINNGSIKTGNSINSKETP